VKVSEGIEEDGIVVGNAYDKYGSRNPIVRRIMGGFHDALDELVQKSAPETIHEVGCGEGYWVMEWNRKGINVRGSDFSAKVIDIARSNAREAALSEEVYTVRSIYDLDPTLDHADLVVCCEVMEHLEQPEKALEALQKIVGKNLIISVPREPLWCALNLSRGKYIRSLGNTPGHIQHWSTSGFVRLVEKYFEVICVSKPLPWTMLYCRPR
jgi:2-polyprenyl-3-methyl-5-hydroxy-6-metoxy-1,4-benzoquinol methylase